jgi:CBS domain-containing protein
MAVRVSEIMNRELFYVHPEQPAEVVLEDILALGVTGTPVVDGEGQPIGVVSVRDLANAPVGARTRDRMTSPAAVVTEDTFIADAARRIAETGYHRLVVVGEGGRAVGIVSALDIVRGLVGFPARHPAAFPHFDPDSGLRWTDETLLEPEWAAAAPDEPGVLVLLVGGRHVPEVPVWVEAVENIRARVVDLIEAPPTAQPALASLRRRSSVRFRGAVVRDGEERRRVCESIRAGLSHPIPPDPNAFA